jgi:hypothetical protein
MFDRHEQPSMLFRMRLIVGVVSAAALVWPAIAVEGGPAPPDLSGQWGRDMIFFEPPPSGPGPVASTVRKADGTADVMREWAGDHTNPILKPEAAVAVRTYAELAFKGTVAPDLHNLCFPEPPPYVLGIQFGVQIVQHPNSVTLIYLLNNAMRHVRLNVPHPETVTPSWQGHSVGWYEADTLVIDTVGIKAAPFATVDSFGTPHGKNLHVVERYRLIDGEVAADAQRRHGAIARPFNPYGRGDIDTDVLKKGLQVEFTVEDSEVFTTRWSGRVTYRPVAERFPEVVCAENPHFFGTEAAVPTADKPDF